MPTIAFATLGCRVNQYDTDSLRGLFMEAGYTEKEFHEPADVYVINTCSVTHVGEKKSRQLIRRTKKMNPQAAVVVTGCYAQSCCRPCLTSMPSSARTKRNASCPSSKCSSAAAATLTVTP